MLATQQKHRRNKNTPFAVIHIPHSSTIVPDDVRATYLLSEDALKAELLAMTDHFTDALFSLPGDLATHIVFHVSRLVVDPERFAGDEQEIMVGRGMGVVYTKSSNGTPLRGTLSEPERQALLNDYYYPHHQKLTEAVASALAAHDYCLIIDGHSFPKLPLPYEDDQRRDRPDICVGRDDFHTPEWLCKQAGSLFCGAGWSVEVDRPFRGTIVPSGYYQSDRRVLSIMVEVNRMLYVDERDGARLASFDRFRQRLAAPLVALIGYALTQLAP